MNGNDVLASCIGSFKQLFPEFFVSVLFLLQLKQEEVIQRKKGFLHTQEDFPEFEEDMLEQHAENILDK